MQRSKLKRKQRYLLAYTWHQYWAGYHSFILQDLVVYGGSLKKYNRHREKYEKHSARMRELDEKTI